MIGIPEILITVGIILLVIVFGKKTALKAIREMFSFKREMTEVINNETKQKESKD